ncbi:MFS general substrate transporter [Dacryopinax primogenitus]|uniref:MFS general substrate transporter n=1 Tax=Dacryopinax primogenitus (strain DJM 731) TaxID=1858805 RepID=M5FSU3_DACPD|nr:MFS general substrate transporter [Dacryopinax primogenitus]EJT99023.1 MFS general substrate transporter [Dacryopinax primogenitus]
MATATAEEPISESTPLIASRDREHKPSAELVVEPPSPSTTAGPSIPPTPSAAANEDGRVFKVSAASVSVRPADGESAREEELDKPLPKTQIFLLCLARFVEPIAFFSIFPFVNQMIHELASVPTADVGFWSGWIESVFSLMQTVSMLFWGKAADRWGRKPVLVISLAGVAVGSVVFGLAGSVWQMIALRSIAGVFSGTLVTVRTMISENSTPRNQARAFSLFMFAGNMGIFIGPIIGGALSKPASQYPGLFGGVWIFERYPYLFPCIVSGACTALSCAANLLWLKEPIQTGISHKTTTATTKPLTTIQLLVSPGVLPALLIFEYVMLISVLFTALLPLFAYTPISLGGWSFTPPQISLYLAAGGAGQAFWILLVFPPMQHRIGTGNVLRLTAIARPLGLAALPALNMLLRAGRETAFWVLLPIAALLGSSVSMSFTAVQLVLNDITPSPHSLGTLNGLALSLSSAIRALGPVCITSLFAYGVKHQVWAGHLAWVGLVGIALGFAGLLRWLPERCEGRVRRHQD